MAIDWGAWEYSGGNGMRVGIEVTWEAITHGEAAATATVKIYTENQYSYSDPQHLSYGGSIGGGKDYTNNSGGAQVLRDTKSYTYNYGANEYGSSPGSRTFSASVSGTYNGVTPSTSTTSKIPARPYGAPAAPTNASVNRISDDSQKVTWSNKDTSGEPYGNLHVERDKNDLGDWWNFANPGGSATSATQTGTLANTKYKYRVRAENSVGVSGWAYTGAVWTTPAAPTNPTRTGAAGANQTISWTNNVAYNEYQTEVWHAANGVWDSAPLATLAAGVTSYTHTAPSGTVSHTYRVRAKTSSGVALYSAFSATTTASGTASATSPPSAPTGLSPNNTTAPKDAKNAITLSWVYHATDGSAQTKFQIRHRLAGSSTWTTAAAVSSAATSWSLPANTYANNQSVEWQVVTWGADPTASPWATSVVFKTAITKAPGSVVTTTPDGSAVPLQMDLSTGQQQAIGSGTPPSWAFLVGEIKMWPLSTPPAGFLVCDGRAVSRTDYATLFAVLGTSFGIGDGSTTFNLPDYTGRSPRGAAPGAKGGSDQVTLAKGNIPPHTHNIDHSHDARGRETGPGPQTNNAALAGSTGTLHTDSTFVNGTVGVNSADGSGGGLGTAPVTVTSPYLGTTFIIRF